ncbi:NAD(P)/FAD-dependent oxidoreductase [Streptomyces tremellae]|uniref:Flavin-dependent monooxygenase n=1 Tax=Streptomyces tremellae TaxID=1124239 RepID=A0ABP7EN80_9ACTN
MDTPVTVIGAGLGGLTLARVLQVRGVPVVVYEAESSPTARAQGGMLDIHDDNGQVALAAAGLLDEFRGIVVPGGETVRLVGQDGVVLHEMAGEAVSGRPEVQRGELRRLLLDSLAEGTVRWGCRVAGATPLGGGRHEVRFADGRSVVADVLVGADGAWSRVRPLVSDAVPGYVGTTFVETYLFDADTRHPASARVVGGGSMVAPSPGKEIFAHREKGGTLHAYAALSRPQEWFAAIDFSDAAASTARVAREFAGWAPELLALITDGDVPPVLRPHHALPAGLRWGRVPGVTLVGDAAHLAAPNGEGANLAMLDGAELAGVLADHPEDVEGALGAFERAMFERCEEAVTFAGAEMVQDIDSEDNTPQAMLELLTQQTG